MALELGEERSKFGIEVRHISAGDEVGLDGEASLEPVTEWCDLDVGLNPFKAAAVEDYATTLLSGSAAAFIRVQDQRHLSKRSIDDAGLDLEFLRQVWQCLQPEPDRAIAIICGSLGSVDDGDVETTTRRLWHRAVRILRQRQYYWQLQRLARHLREVEKMSGTEVLQFLSEP
jgi:hypothetical protein